MAELYRVVDLLGRAGLSVVTDMGLSDEGDPWFVFCRLDNGEVIAHFARIDGVFIAVSIAVDETFRGANFRQIVDRMVSSQPLVVPPPGQGGSRLLLHPAVLLTAFVATALAHSEKMKALELLHSIEAQWDHARSGVHDELKHVKTAWAETLQTLLKLPHDSRIGHDSVKEGLSLTLASLIAIAMTALQPIADEIASIAQIVRYELSGHGPGADPSGATHSFTIEQAVQSILDEAPHAAKADSASHELAAHDSAGGPQQHKLAVADSSSPDMQKQAIDTIHAVAISAVQKEAVPAEDAPHLPAIEAQANPDANGTFLLIQQQKAAAIAAAVAAAAATQPAETFTVHVDAGFNSTQAIAITDVTQEALKILNINFKSGDALKPGDSGEVQTPATASHDVSSTIPASADTATSPVTVIAAAGSASTPTLSSGQPSTTPAQVETPAVVTTATPQPAPVTSAAAPQTVDTTADPGGGVQAIVDFANNASHVVTQQSFSGISSSLGQELQNYFVSGSNTLKVIFFESSMPMADIFSLSAGVVFIAEKDISPTTQFSNAGGNLILDVAGGTVTLVGVATIEHSVSTV